MNGGGQATHYACSKKSKYRVPRQPSYNKAGKGSKNHGSFNSKIENP